jgi:hypothetical protein
MCLTNAKHPTGVANNSCLRSLLSRPKLEQISLQPRFIPEIINKFSIYRLLEIRATDEDVQRYLEGHMFRLPRLVVRSPKLQEQVKTNIVQTLSKVIGRK